MRLSIRVWAILALNVFVVGVTCVLGWIAQDAAGRVVEERFVQEMVVSVSGFLKDKPFPLSNSIMGYLHEMFNADWVTVDGGGRVVGSSLSEAMTKEFEQRVGGVGPAGTISLGGRPYRIDSHAAPVRNIRAGGSSIEPASYRLYMLVPFSQFQDARKKAAGEVAAVVLPAAGAATALALLLAFGIAHPIRRLTREMDHLATDQGEPADSSGRTPADAKVRHNLVARGPKETRRLAESFYGLLDRLAAARRRLAQNERLAALGKISLSVAHELRNPLSGIKMNVRVLQDRMGPGGDEGVAAIGREIDRMGLYLDELMSLSPNTEPAARQLALAPVRLSSLSESVLTILAGRLRHAKVAVQKNYPSDEPLVPADANQVRQVMMNFLVNAVEAMPAGGTVTLSIQPRRDAVRFSVADAGKGVQAGGADIFEAFSTNKPNGVGLGLYLSKQIISRHHGQIGYDNLAPGAVFWFELPTEAEENEQI